MNARSLISAAVLPALFFALGPGCSSTVKSGKHDEITTDAGRQLTFATPQGAVDALIAAAKNDNRDELRRIFGPEVDRLKSGENAQDKVDLQIFVAAYNLNHFLFDNGDNTYTLVMGLQEWEFPAPIVAAGERWRFDTIEGIEEVITRTIGMNELHVLDAAAAFIEAQDQFHAMDSNKDNVPEYAMVIRSGAGKRDGLYWPDEPGQPQSPLGPTFARAIASGEFDASVQTRQSYRGYYYRILTSQGPGAPGGAMNYIDDTGRMTKGYALIAWPAAYDETGVMTFIVGSNGDVHQRDLGEDTSAEVEKIVAYDPAGWDAIDG